MKLIYRMNSLFEEATKYVVSVQKNNVNILQIYFIINSEYA